MLTNRSAVWVAIETSTCQVELELAPAVEILLVRESPVAALSEALAFSRESGVHQGMGRQAPGQQSRGAHSLTSWGITDCQLAMEGKQLSLDQWFSKCRPQNPQQLLSAY